MSYSGLLNWLSETVAAFVKILRQVLHADLSLIELLYDIPPFKQSPEGFNNVGVAPST
jgi:hypothetical protein